MFTTRFHSWMLLIAPLCGAVWLACYIEQAPPVAAKRWSANRQPSPTLGRQAHRSLTALTPQPPRGWRRTAQGWQRADAWQPFPVFNGPGLHPLTVALLLTLLSLLTLVAAASPGRSNRREKARPRHRLQSPRASGHRPNHPHQPDRAAPPPSATASPLRC